MTTPYPVWVLRKDPSRHLEIKHSEIPGTSWQCPFCHQRKDDSLFCITLEEEVLILSSVTNLHWLLTHGYKVEAFGLEFYDS